MGDGENVEEALRLFYERVKRARKSRGGESRAAAFDPGKDVERLVDELVEGFVYRLPDHFTSGNQLCSNGVRNTLKN